MEFLVAAIVLGILAILLCSVLAWDTFVRMPREREAGLSTIDATTRSKTVRIRKQGAYQ